MITIQPGPRPMFLSEVGENASQTKSVLCENAGQTKSELCEIADA